MSLKDLSSQLGHSSCGFRAIKFIFDKSPLIQIFVKILKFQVSFDVATTTRK